MIPDTVMSLTDLKNKKSKKSKRKLSIDEFIDDAAAYAQGKSILETPPPKPPRTRNYKNATFTLSPLNIEHLSHMAETTGIAKSKLVRTLIEHAMAQSLDELVEQIKQEEKVKHKAKKEAK